MDQFTNNSIRIGRIVLAFTLFAIGIQQFILGDVVAGRAPAWPEGIPGRMAWAIISGLILMTPLAAILIGKRARTAVLLVGAIIFCWGFLRYIPLVAAHPTDGGSWTNMGKSLAWTGAAAILAASLPVSGRVAPGGINAGGKSSDKLLLAGRVFIGLFFILGGIQHFIYAEFVQMLVPEYIPGHLFWTYFAALALIAGGTGLVSGILLRQAALLSAFMLLAWVVLLHIPRAVSINNANEWTSVFEASGFSAALFLLSGLLNFRYRLHTFSPVSHNVADRESPGPDFS